MAANEPCAFLVIEIAKLSAAAVLHDEGGAGVLTDQRGAKRRLPDRKHSADIIDRCAEYTEREAAANQGEQHDRFHAVDLLDVKFVSEVGHGALALGIGKARNSTFCRLDYLVISIGGCDRCHTRKADRSAITRQLLAIRRGSSRVSSLAVDRRPF
jgi:hypothetical protein